MSTPSARPVTLPIHRGNPDMWPVSPCKLATVSATVIRLVLRAPRPPASGAGTLRTPTRAC